MSRKRSSPRNEDFFLGEVKGEENENGPSAVAIYQRSYENRPIVTPPKVTTRPRTPKFARFRRGLNETFKKIGTSFKRVFTRKHKSPESMPLLTAKPKQSPLYRRIGKGIGKGLRATGEGIKTSYKYIKGIPKKIKDRIKRNRMAKTQKKSPSQFENRPDENQYA
jgi:hypothetical protein